MVVPAPEPQPAATGPVPPVAVPSAGRRLLWLSLLVAFCALATIGIVSYVGWHIGPVALGVGITGALLPVPVLVACFVWLDRYQPSPTWLIAACFLWGAGVATSAALLVNTQAAARVSAMGLSDELVGVLVAPFIEELAKASLPLLLFMFYRRAFTGIVDAVVFCGLSAAGFAMVENILYLGGHGFAAESDKGFAAGAFATTMTFILRVPLSGFAHPLFTSLAGIGIGVAARSTSRVVRVVAPVVGLLAAMAAHGSWNLMAVLAGAQSPYILLYGYVSVFVPFFFLMLGLLLWIRSWEGRLGERVLPRYARAGWFTPPEVAALGSLGRRASARAWARRVAGEPGRAAMIAYQAAASELAVLRDRMDRGWFARSGQLAAAVAREQRLLDAVNSYRQMFSGRDPYTRHIIWQSTGYRIFLPDGTSGTVAEPAAPVVPVLWWWTPPVTPVAAGTQR